MKRIIFLLLITTLTYAQNNKIHEAFFMSYSAEATGNYAKAIQCLRNVYDDSSYEINMRLGWLYYNFTNYGESVGYYQKAVNLMPYSIEAKLGLALPVSAMGNWNDVENIYKAILKINPEYSIVNYRLGSIYYDRKQYDMAFNHLEKVVNQFPMDYNALILYAWTNYQMDKLREAKVLFSKVLLIKPNDASALEGLKLIQ